MQSDDDINTTTSDIDSAPATPSSQVDPSEEANALYTHDGLFKIPRARNDSCASQLEQEYIIAQRTRSKISLAETPIEAIESTFKAPDAPLDMYQSEPDLDPEWFGFLQDYMNPLRKISTKSVQFFFSDKSIFFQVRKSKRTKMPTRTIIPCLLTISQVCLFIID